MSSCHSSTRRWSTRAGCRPTSSWPGTERPRQCPARCSRSPATSGRFWAVPPSGWAGATIALVAIFLPSFLLIFGTLPFWDTLRGSTTFRRALAGTNAAVVGLLLAALYTPVWTNAIGGPVDVAIAAVALGLLVVGKAPPILVVGLTALLGQLVGV